MQQYTPQNYPNKTEFRDMYIYDLVRQAADAWNIPLDEVAQFQEWWDSDKTAAIAQKILQAHTPLSYNSHENPSQRFSQFYKAPVTYATSLENSTPSIANLLDIAQYYLQNTEVTIPHFVITIASKDLSDIGELGESVLVLISPKEFLSQEKKKKYSPMPILEYLKKVQRLVGNIQIVSKKSLPDLYISNSLSFKFSINFPIKCRNLILAQKVKIEGINFMPYQMQVMGGI